MSDNTNKSRRLLPLFLASTLLPAICLCWLGWRVVEEDRLYQRNRFQEQRGQAADLAASALQRVLAEAEERLATFNAAPPRLYGDQADGLAFLAFERTGTVEHAGIALPYYPAVPDAGESEAGRFALVDELEFQKRDYPGALHALDTIAHNSKPALAAAALLRIARIYRKSGDIPSALAKFTALGNFGSIIVEGRPAALLGRQGRALIFESTGRRDELQLEAAALCEDLENGRWMVSGAVFESSYEQARQWLAVPRPPIDVQRLAMAEAADSLWQEWRTVTTMETNGRSRRTLQVDGTSLLVLTRSTAGRRTVLLMPPHFLDTAWLQRQHSAGRFQNIDFALTDAEGQPVLGESNVALSLQTIQAPSATQLPWTLHAISKGKAQAQRLSLQTKIVLAGIIMMAIIALAGGYFINRAILQELRVARLQSDFVAAVSHEFRTPLTTIRQLAELLVNGRVTNDDRRALFYETLLHESKRLQQLVDGLLNFGRMEAGQLRYHFEFLDPEQFVRDIVSEFEREVVGRGYHIELQGVSGLAIRADRQSLARVFWNLLDNAVKYSPENRTVWVDVSEAGRRLAVRVRDRGIGIPAAEQSEIFEKFVRGAAPKSASIQGTGVGLAMARQIVAAHGGNISVESKPGEGSVFTVLLPLTET